MVVKAEVKLWKSLDGVVQPWAFEDSLAEIKTLKRMRCLDGFDLDLIAHTLRLAYRHIRLDDERVTAACRHCGTCSHDERRPKIAGECLYCGYLICDWERRNIEERGDCCPSCGKDRYGGEVEHLDMGGKHISVKKKFELRSALSEQKIKQLPATKSTECKIEQTSMEWKEMNATAKPYVPGVFWLGAKEDPTWFFDNRFNRAFRRMGPYKTHAQAVEARRNAEATSKAVKARIAGRSTKK